MAKYNFEFKLKLIQEYLDGKGAYRYLSKKYGINDTKQLRNWVNIYKKFGEEGLCRKHQNKKYSVQFKLNAIELYQMSEMSYSEGCVSFVRRVLRDFQIRKDVLLIWLRKKKI